MYVCINTYKNTHRHIYMCICMCMSMCMCMCMRVGVGVGEWGRNKTSRRTAQQHSRKIKTAHVCPDTH